MMHYIYAFGIAFFTIHSIWCQQNLKTNRFVGSFVPSAHQGSPRFIPRSMTSDEYQRLKTYIESRLADAQQNNDERLIKKYKELEVLLKELNNKTLNIAQKKDENIYTKYFNLVIAELESLGENPQAILQETGLRIKMLQGQLERSWFLIKEIVSLEWQFEHDTEQKAKNLIAGANTKPYISPWPKVQDKAWYIITLVDQLYRSHDFRASDQETDTASSILDEYLVRFLPQASTIVGRAIQQARAKIATIRQQRNLSPLIN